MKYLRATKNGVEYRIGLENQPSEFTNHLHNGKHLYWESESELYPYFEITESDNKKDIRLLDEEIGHFSKGCYTLIINCSIETTYTTLLEAELQTTSSGFKSDEIVIPESNYQLPTIFLCFHFTLEHSLDNFDFHIKLSFTSSSSGKLTCGADLYKGFIKYNPYYDNKWLKLTKNNNVYYAKLHDITLNSGNSGNEDGIRVKNNNSNRVLLLKNDLTLYSFTELSYTYNELEKKFHY